MAAISGPLGGEQLAISSISNIVVLHSTTHNKHDAYVTVEAPATSCPLVTVTIVDSSLAFHDTQQTVNGFDT